MMKKHHEKRIHMCSFNEFVCWLLFLVDTTCVLHRSVSMWVCGTNLVWGVSHTLTCVNFSVMWTNTIQRAGNCNDGGSYDMCCCLLMCCVYLVGRSVHSIKVRYISLWRGANLWWSVDMRYQSFLCTKRMFMMFVSINETFESCFACVWDKQIVYIFEHILHIQHDTPTKCNTLSKLHKLKVVLQNCN